MNRKSREMILANLLREKYVKFVIICAKAHAECPRGHMHSDHDDRETRPSKQNGGWPPTGNRIELERVGDRRKQATRCARRDPRAVAGADGDGAIEQVVQRARSNG